MTRQNREFLALSPNERLGSGLQFCILILH